jgi:hypothetical protein
MHPEARRVALGLHTTLLQALYGALGSVAQSEIVHAFLESTTCRDLVRELGHSPPVDSNELFDIATSFAFGEEAACAIFDGRKSKEPQQKRKWGKKGKKPRCEARAGARRRRGRGPCC